MVHAFEGILILTTKSFCYRYTEEYVPGYYNKHGRYVGGYVKSRKKKVPCWSINRPSYPDRYEDPAPNVGGGVDDNSCVEGAVLGGILGGGAGAAASRGDGRWWAIPPGHRWRQYAWMSG